MEKELIKTINQKDGAIVVDGRDLHDFLGVDTPYTMWIDRMMGYGFAENVDFSVFNKNVSDESMFGGTRKIKDHALTLDMAKELSMIQRTDRGKEARQYFIAMEKQAKSNELRMPRDYPSALRALADSYEENEKLKPDANYTRKILNNHGLETTSVIAKNYGMTTIKFNRLLHDLGVQFKQGNTWLLYSKYEDKGYTHVEPYQYYNSYTGQLDISNYMKWTQLGQKFLYDLLADKGIYPKIEFVDVKKIAE